MDRTTVRKLSLPFGIIAVSVVVLIALFLLITQRLTDLRESPSDNLTWALTQVEVDLLKLDLAAERAMQSGSPDLEFLRQRFNNVYSRVDGIVQGPVFSEMRRDPDFMHNLQWLHGHITGLAPKVDAPDADLIAQLDELQTQVNTILDRARQLSIKGIELAAMASDQERSSLATLLTAVETVSGAVIIVFLGVLSYILRQSRETAKISKIATQANARLKSTFDVSLDAIIVANDVGEILEFNDAAEQVFGFTKQDVIGQPMVDLIVPAQHRAAHTAGMERFRKTGEKRLIGKGRIEISALRKSGEEFPVEISIGQSRDDRGPIYISYVRDITHRMESENTLKRARDEALQAEAAKSNFLAVMSHEMRTPLNGVFGALELLRASPLTKDQSKYLDIAQQSGGILLSHVNNVLDVTRIDAGKLELVEDGFDLEQFFKDVVVANSPTAANKGNQLHLDLQEFDAPFVRADKQRLRQIVYNLLGNALKFTENGDVTVSAELQTAPGAPATLVFSVADTGVGIEPADVGRIFERFYTQEKSYDRMAPGTGLGLAICKQLLDLMGGNISVQSTPGKGSTFRVHVPVTPFARPDETQTHDAETETLPGLDGAHVLLVEDNEINRLIVRQMLESAGATVSEAHDGVQAVKAAQQVPFSAILMDISMPVMNGIDASKAISTGKGPNADTPILALTAHALDEQQDVFREAGLLVGLRKPLARSELVNAIASILTSSPRPPPGPIEKTPPARLNKTITAELHEVFDADRMADMLSRFEAEIDITLQTLRAQQGLLPPDDLAALAHKSVGSAGLMGAERLQIQLRALEQAFRTTPLPPITQRLSEADTEWAKTRKMMRKVLASGIDVIA